MSWLKVRDWASGVEYSNLFHSGIRAISLRPRCQRSQPSSNSVSLPAPKTGSTGRRSSVVSLSSRILRRSVTTRHNNGSPAPTAEAEKRVRPRPSSMFVASTKEAPDFWSSEGTKREGEEDQDVDCSGATSLADTADPFSSLPGSHSFFVHLGDIDTSPTFTKVDPFPLLSNFPDVPRHRPTPRRPMSMQTAPPSYQKSSLYYRSTEKLDAAWMLEESSPELKAQECGDNADVSDMSLDVSNAANSDWRQFHVDWLQNEPSLQLI
ncbi:hypothetical protein F5I97DRAFT_1812076 [Phlebopus sp. FC_14]|nr:hypothetical protein F5I97DRAFT_1812076 [Phlebopus sp. FC_14]